MKRRGLSLAEIVLSLFLVLLVVVLVMQLYPVAMASLRDSAQKLQADAWADSLMADYLNMPFSQLNAAQPAPSPIAARGATLQAAVEVQPVQQQGSDPDRVRSVRITITWDDRGVHHQIVREQWRTNVQQ